MSLSILIVTKFFVKEVNILSWTENNNGAFIDLRKRAKKLSTACDTGQKSSRNLNFRAGATSPQTY